LADKYPVRPGVTYDASNHADAGDSNFDRGPDRSGQPLVKAHERTFTTGAVGDLSGQLAPLVGGQLRLEVVEEPLPPHRLPP
jgi:hypothetical protein